jgi:branched-subunit amino acid transport protein AzlD
VTAAQALTTIGILALCTLVTRALPCWIFSGEKAAPPYVLYLGKVLPYAVIGMLIVYCLKSADLKAAPHALPEAIGLCVTGGIYVRRRHTLFSIVGGTLAYMAALYWL